MKARELKKRLAELGWHNTGMGSKHEKWTDGIHSVAIPRHREIAEGTARAILKEALEYGRTREIAEGTARAILKEALEYGRTGDSSS